MLVSRIARQEDKMSKIKVTSELKTTTQQQQQQDTTTSYNITHNSQQHKISIAYGESRLDISHLARYVVYCIICYWYRCTLKVCFK